MHSLAINDPYTYVDMVSEEYIHSSLHKNISSAGSSASAVVASGPSHLPLPAAIHDTAIPFATNNPAILGTNYPHTKCILQSRCICAAPVSRQASAVWPGDCYLPRSRGATRRHRLELWFDSSQV